MKVLLGILTSIGLATGVFYLIFFKLAAHIASLIPASSWKPLLDLAVYVLVAWFGGVGLPLAILFIGVATSLGWMFD